MGGTFDGDQQKIVAACAAYGTSFTILSAISVAILCRVNWRPWRLYSYVIMLKWPTCFKGLHMLSTVSGILSYVAWALVLSPVLVLVLWGVRLVVLLERDTIGLAVIMPGTALLLSFYAIMLWWRTQWQSSRIVAVLLLIAVSLLCAYEISAVYVTAGRSFSRHYSASGFFFGVSAIALAINMLFICKMVFDGSGLNLDEYVRRSYKYAYADCVEVGPVACLPEPPDLKDPFMQKQKRAFHPIILYLGSVLALLIYSISYGFTAEKARWLGGVTSAAVIIFDSNVGACLFGFELLRSRVVALFIAGTYRIFLICFGVHYWYLGHCIGYAVVASVLLGAAVIRHFSASDAAAARRVFLENARVRLREGFRRKGPGSSSSFSEGRASSAKGSSSVDPSQIVLWHGVAQGAGAGVEDANEGLNSARSIDSGRGSVAMHTSSRPSTVQDSDIVAPSTERHLEKLGLDMHKTSVYGPTHVLEVQNFGSSASTGTPAEPVVLDLNSGPTNDPRIIPAQRNRTRHGEQELTTLFQDKGLDPNFAMMYEETGIHPPLLALLQRASLDADRDHRDNTEGTAASATQVQTTQAETVSLSEELRRMRWDKWLHMVFSILQLFAGTPERAWVLFSLIFVAESVMVAVFRPKTVTIINATHEQFEFGFSALLLSPVICSVIAFICALQAEKMVLSSRPRKFGMIAWLLSTSVGLLLSFLSKSSILLGVSITLPLMVVCLSFLIPIWVNNGYRFYVVPVDDQSSTLSSSNQQGCLGSKEGIIMTISILLLMGCIFALGAIISLKPLDDLSYHGWNGDQRSVTSPYTSSIYLGWAIASAFALVITGVLPAVSWFATYRFSMSSAVCVGIFIVVLFTFCGGSYVGVVQTRGGQVPVKADFLAALLPLVCIPAMLSLCCGLYKWKDDGWQFSQGVYVFLGIGLFLLLGAISAVIATINPWMVGVALLLFLLLLVLAVSVIHYWASHNFYLTRMEMLLVCLAAFILALAAFLVGLLANEPFVGASVGYFALLFLLAGRALTALLSPPVVVYSPRLLPVYVYDAHADCAKNVSGAYLVLYGIALATAGWGVVASLEIYPPFAGAATSAITLVVAFGFAVSRPSLTLKMVETALQFLSKDTVVQAIARSATKTRNALSGTYSAPQRSASSTALLVGDPKMGRDKGGNYVLPREDVLKLRERLNNQELAAGSWFCKPKVRMIYHHHETCSEAQAHAKIFLLEEALDTEWVYMWDKFGGYLLLLLGLAAKAERVQDEVRLRLFLDSKGFSDLSEKKMKKWQSEDYKEFETMQESFIREKEMEDELMLQRREEEGRGKERRKLLLEKEERRRREVEAAVLSSVPNAGSKEAAAVAAAARAVAGDILYDEARTAEQVSCIVQRVLSRQRAERAQHIGVEGAVCIVDAEPRSDGRLCGVIDLAVCGSLRVTFAAAVLVEVGSGPVCLLGTEARNQLCLEILISGTDLLAFEGGQIGLRLVMKGERQTIVTRDWNIGSQNLADGRWHTISVTIDAEIGEAATYLDGKFDDSQSGLSIPAQGGVWQEGADVWVGVKPPVDLDAFGRSDSEGAEPRMQIMDVFVWGRCLSGEEIETVHNSIGVDEIRAKELWEDEWQSEDSSCRGEDSSSEPADMDLYVREEALSEEQLQSGRKRKAEREVAIEMDYISRKLRRPKMETQEEVNQRMRAVELAVKEALAARGERYFTDQEFPPSNQSLFVDPETPSAKLQVVNEWMRPMELLRERGSNCEPCLFAGPADASDVCQGRLGDCWFLSAVAVLTEASRISEVIVTPAYNDCGIYTVRFCIQGEWVPVVVDDWIPCESRGKPAFATSRKDNELWVTLLEKAYAKLHGSYEALEGGLVQDALVDLTGGAGEEIDLKSAQAQIDLASGRLWSQLLRFKQEGFLLGAGSPSGSDAHVSSSGIVQGHAYSLLQVKEVDGHKLVQIHNPWANEVEWNGPWSDSSPEWNDRMKFKLKYLPQAQDGVFWMAWEDFQLHFCSIYVCRIYPPELRYSIRGQWRGLSAGGCQDYCSWPSNPQFRLKAIGPDARHPIHVFVTLTQGVHFSSKKRSGFANYQFSGDPSNYYIGMRILQTRGNRAKYNIFMHESVGGTDYVNSREIAFEMVLDPAPKGYTIVPSTLNPMEEAPFVLSVFTKASIKLEPL